MPNKYRHKFVSKEGAVYELSFHLDANIFGEVEIYHVRSDTFVLIKTNTNRAYTVEGYYNERFYITLNVLPKGVHILVTQQTTVKIEDKLITPER